MGIAVAEFKGFHSLRSTIETSLTTLGLLSWDSCLSTDSVSSYQKSLLMTKKIITVLARLGILLY